MKGNSIETEAEILKKIDEQLKGFSADTRPEAFRILVERHLGRSPDAARSKQSRAKAVHVKRGGTKARPQLAVIKDLDLRKDDANSSLRDFYSEKQPATFLERNAVFVYYLQRLKEVASIGPNHIFTCYKEVNLRVPGAFYQSLLDTRTKGWIDTTDTEDMRITTVGENFVEHDLPRQTKD